MEFETKCLHSGYEPENGQPHALPIYQSTTFDYASTEYVQQLFDLNSDGFFYSRLANPTVDAVERKIATLEGGVGALCTSSGQSASMLSVLNILGCGDHFLCSAEVYGGTYNLFNVTLRKLGIEVTFFDSDMTDAQIEALIRPNTKAIFGETITNPTISVFDIERFAGIAHAHNMPLIIDNTFATPYLCRPFDFGADIVTHSTSKYMDGHSVQLGGVIVDSGKFDWSSGDKFPGLTQPDDSYHGVVYTKQFGAAAYIVKARVQLMRDMGCCQSAQGAFYINEGLETLPLRMRQHCENAQKVAEFLAAREEVEFVHYPTLPGSKYGALAAKYLPRGCSGVISFSLKGGREAGVKFIDSLKLISLVVHVADIRTCVLHPASSTHRQLTDQELIQGGITPGLIRMSVGCEAVEDILQDIEQALV